MLGSTWSNLDIPNLYVLSMCVEDFSIVFDCLLDAPLIVLSYFNDTENKISTLVVRRLTMWIC